MDFKNFAESGKSDPSEDEKIFSILFFYFSTNRNTFFDVNDLSKYAERWLFNYFTSLYLKELCHETTKDNNKWIRFDIKMFKVMFQALFRMSVWLNQATAKSAI